MKIGIGVNKESQVVMVQLSEDTGQLQVGFMLSPEHALGIGKQLIEAAESMPKIRIARLVPPDDGSKNGN
jgi:hypothetical protein